MVLWKSGLTIQGTDAERLAIPATSLQEGWKFLVLEDFIEFMWNGSVWVPLQTSDGVIMSDNFDGTTIDTSKWLETDPDNVISQNNEILYITPNVAQPIGLRNRMTTVLSINKGIIECVAELKSDVTSQPQDFVMGIFRDVNNAAFWSFRGTLSDNNIKTVVKVGGTDQLNETTPEQNPRFVKVQYNFDTQIIKFFIDVAGVWEQKSADQNIDLSGGNPLFGVIGENSNNTFFVNSNDRVDNFSLVKGVMASPP